MKQKITLTAAAKVNLYLHVTGRRADGYHRLDSLAVFTDFGDTVEIEEADAFSFSLYGYYVNIFSAEERDESPASTNLAVRAARAMSAAADRNLNLRLALEKHIPLSAGLGGGSADAAATVRGLLQLWNLSENDIPDFTGLLLGLGADVPACFESRPLVMRGIGEEIHRTPALPPLSLVLVNPGLPCPTAKIFRNGELSFIPQIGIPRDLGTMDALIPFLERTENALTPAAISVVPAIGDILDALRRQPGCRLARMSGSGATCFGLFENESDASRAANDLALSNPGWWIKTTRLFRP